MKPQGGPSPPPCPGYRTVHIRAGPNHRPAGKAKVQAAHNKANRGNSSVAVKRVTDLVRGGVLDYIKYPFYSGVAAGSGKRSFFILALNASARKSKGRSRTFY